MATKKKTEKYCVYTPDNWYDSFVGSLKDCEGVAAEWFAEQAVDSDIVIAKLVPIKSLPSDIKSYRLPWNML